VPLVKALVALLVVRVIEPLALPECTGCGNAGGNAFRATSLLESPRLAPSDSIAGNEIASLKGTFAKVSESRALSLNFSSTAVAPTRFWAPEELSESRWDGAITAETGPIDLTGVAEGVPASTGRAVEEGFSELASSVSGGTTGVLRPAINPTVKPTIKNTIAVMRSPTPFFADFSVTKSCEGESSVPRGDDSTLLVAPRIRNPRNPKRGM
jgi:hypothetical protein